MLFITGDTHQYLDVHKLNTENFPAQRELTRDDFVIICGDFGCIWEESSKQAEYWLCWHENKPYTTLFVGGNHENWELLNSYPVEIWNGGKIHRVMPNVIHLMNGQIYTIGGETFFVMGGATSSDKCNRISGVDWWEGEEPTIEELTEGLYNLEKYNYKVDYVLTHTVSAKIKAQELAKYTFKNLSVSRVETYLDFVSDYVEFKHWFFGHFHDDITMWAKYRLLFDSVVKLEEGLPVVGHRTYADRLYSAKRNLRN